MGSATECSWTWSWILGIRRKVFGWVGLMGDLRRLVRLYHFLDNYLRTFIDIELGGGGVMWPVTGIEDDGP